MSFFLLMGEFRVCLVWGVLDYIGFDFVLDCNAFGFEIELL